MADDDLDPDYFCELLLQHQAELLQVAKTGDEAARPVELDQTRVGRLSRMDAMQGQAMSQEVQRRREQQLLRIKQALLRLQNDEYGECRDCGGMIAKGRLQADPTATLCIHCAEKNDR